MLDCMVYEGDGTEKSNSAAYRWGGEWKQFQAPMTGFHKIVFPQINTISDQLVFGYSLQKNKQKTDKQKGYFSFFFLKICLNSNGQKKKPNLLLS